MGHERLRKLVRHVGIERGLFVRDEPGNICNAAPILHSGERRS